MTSLTISLKNKRIGFSVFDKLTFSDNALPFGDVLSANHIRDLFVEMDNLFGYGADDLWNTGLTLWAFVGQVLQDGKQRSCNAAVTHATRYMIEHGMTPPSPDSGEYCRARLKLDHHVLRRLVGHIANEMAQAIPSHWCWQGKHVKLVDGFTFSMPDTDENQLAFPQPKTQKKGVGFPIARACAVLSLANACIHDVAIGPYIGKETGETALLRQVLDCFTPGDIMLADRYFCSYFMLAILKSRGIDGCMRLHQLRKIDPSKVKWLGPNDYIDTWYRPQRAKWMSPSLYDSLPETYPTNQIGSLYHYRWCAELDIFSIKQMLNLDILRCKSPEMIHREFWITLLAYNMVRLVCSQAAFVHEKQARQMSFTIACNILLSQWLMPPDKAIRSLLSKHNLFQIACNEVGNRPGRIEPRVVKRRLKKYTLMTKPRKDYKSVQTTPKSVAGK
jgi:putative transposase